MKNNSIVSKLQLYFLATTILTSFSLNLHAQTAPAKQWDKNFGGSNDDHLFTMDKTSDGGSILGGYSFSNISGDKSQNCKGGADFWIVKNSATGTKQWDKTFGGNLGDAVRSIKQTSDGGYIIGGETISDIGGDKSEASRGDIDYWIIKVDASGNKQWDKTFGGTNVDLLNVVQQTSDGGYILAGESDSNNNGDKSQLSKGGSDFWVIKLDVNGTKLWDKTIGANSSERLSSIIQTPDNGYLIGGTSESGISGDKTQHSHGNVDVWIIKIDSNGNKLWDKSFGGSIHEAIGVIQPTSDGGFILGSYSNSNISGDKSENSKGGHDYWIIKLNANGGKIWDKTIGGNSDELIKIIQQTSDGGYIIGGNSDSNISGDKSEDSKGDTDFWLVKLNSNGNKVWDKTIGGNNLNILYSLFQTSDGGYLVGGATNSPISGDKSQPGQGLFDFWIVKLGPEILGTSESQPTFNLSISPNPNQGKFRLNLTDLKTTKAEITITDLLGRKILEKLVQVTNNQLSEELILPAAKGMYLLQVKAGEELVTRKIVIE